MTIVEPRTKNGTVRGVKISFDNAEEMIHYLPDTNKLHAEKLEDEKEKCYVLTCRDTGKIIVTHDEESAKTIKGKNYLMQIASYDTGYDKVLERKTYEK